MRKARREIKIGNLIHQLGSRENELGDLVESANLKFQGVDFETWLEYPIWYRPFHHETRDGVKCRRAVFLGFASVNGQWQLAIREGTYNYRKADDGDGEDAETNGWATDLAAARALSSEPRYIKAKAVDVLIDLIREIHFELRGMVVGLNCGEQWINEL
jgi:hypothetical protein